MEGDRRGAPWAMIHKQKTNSSSEELEDTQCSAKKMKGIISVFK